MERTVFTGYLWDKETNLFFAKARFYDPEVGRFISQDSFLGQVDEPPSLHRYFYAWNRPTFWTDRSGHAPGDWWDTRSYDWGVFGKTAVRQAGRIVVGTGKAAVGLAKETAGVIHDASVLSYEVATGSDTGAQLWSNTAKSSAGRLGKGEWVGDVTQDVAISTVTGVAKGLVNGQVIEGEINAYVDYRTGNASLDQLEGRMADAAGSGVVNAGLGFAASKGWLGKAPQLPTFSRAMQRLRGAEPAAPVDTTPSPGYEQPNSGTATGPLEGSVEFRHPPGATAEQIRQVQEYCTLCNEAREAGALSPEGRVATAGQLRADASRSAAVERAENPTLYEGKHVGHVPDTTWTGKPDPYTYLPLDPSVNTSLGSQAAKYPRGYKPTEFKYLPDEE